MPKYDYTTIDEYISRFEPDRQKVMQQVRKAIRKAAPKAEERISWGMPTFWQKHNVVHFAMNKNHLGFYPGGEAIPHFADRLADYKTSKGGIQFPLTKPMPLELIADITRWQVKNVAGE